MGAYEALVREKKNLTVSFLMSTILLQIVTSLDLESLLTRLFMKHSMIHVLEHAV